MIGKYADLPVHKKIAVYRNGFSTPAIKKAAKHGIDAIALEKVEEINWDSQFMKFGMMLVTRTTRLVTIDFETDPGQDTVLPKDAIVSTDKDGEVGTLFSFFGWFFQNHVLVLVNQHLNERYFELFRVVADLDKTLYTEVPINYSSGLFAQVNGVKYRIYRAAFKIISTFACEDKPVEHFKMGDTLVSFEKFDEVDFPDPFTMVQIPIPDTPGQVRLLTPPGARLRKQLDEGVQRV